MLFEKILNEKHQLLWPQFEKLYELIQQNQTHFGDLLLVVINGFHNPDVNNWDNVEEKMSPYVFGKSVDGWAENTHYDFIGNYIHGNILKDDPEEYAIKFIYSEERKKEIDALQFSEAISIQTEMLIYIKIWESDTFIKKLSQLVALLNREPYEWHLTLSGTGKHAHISRSQFIKEKIIKRLKLHLPILHNSFQKSYLTQVRNAIAHSQYSILGRHIQLNNFKEGSTNSNLRVLNSDEWSDIFHETLVLYTCYHKLLRAVNKKYGELAIQNGKSFEIRINRKDPIQDTEFRGIYYDDFFESWNWQPEK